MSIERVTFVAIERLAPLQQDHELLEEPADLLGVTGQ